MTTHDQSEETARRLYETIAVELGGQELQRIKGLPVFDTMNPRQQEFLCRVFLEANVMGAFFCLDLLEGKSLAADGSPLPIEIMAGMEKSLYVSEHFMSNIQEDFQGNP